MDHKKSTGHSWCIVGDLFRRNNVTSAACSGYRAKGAGHPSHAVPRCRPTPNHRETIVVVAITCPRRGQLSYLRPQSFPGPADSSCSKIGTIDARVPAQQTCPAACVGLRRPPRDLIPVFKVGLQLHWHWLCQCRFPKPGSTLRHVCGSRSLQSCT